MKNQFTLYQGHPGTGKSTLLKKMVNDLNNKCHIICPTWTSSLQVGGTTIYNFCQCACIQKFKPKKFMFQHVFVDEVFMFSKIEFSKILQCQNENTIFYLFGDAFQLKNIGQDYFYDSINQNIQVVSLNTFYRSQNCQTLQNILLKYTIDKKIIIQNQFKRIKLQQIKDLILQKATIITGTHQKKEYYQTYISQRFKKDLIYAIDGNQYRKGQTVYTISQFDAIKTKYTLIDQIDNQLILEDQNQQIIKIDFYTKGGKTFYPVCSGDCLVINVLQGQTLEKVIIDIDSLFESGSFYTAISRVKRIEDIYIISKQEKQIVFEADLQNKFIK